MRSELPAPLQPPAGRDGGHLLVENHDLGVAVRGLAGKRAAEPLVVDPGLEAEHASVIAAHAAARGQRAGSRVVDLARGAVATLLVVPVGAGEERHIGGHPPLHPPVERLVRRVGGDVDLAPPGRLDDFVAVGREGLALQAQSQRAPDVVAEHIDGPRVVASVAAFHLERPLGDGAGAEVDDAAQRVVPPHAGAAAPHHLDLVQPEQRHPVPVHPAPEGIIDGDIVEQDERAAPATGPNAAEGDALGGGVGHHAGGAAEQAEARHLAKQVVHRLAG
jgi:hypothetical protein